MAIPNGMAKAVSLSGEVRVKEKDQQLLAAGLQEIYPNCAITACVTANVD